jgi:hypothetical protein
MSASAQSMTGTCTRGDRVLTVDVEGRVNRKTGSGLSGAVDLAAVGAVSVVEAAAAAEGVGGLSPPRVSLGGAGDGGMPGM